MIQILLILISPQHFNPCACKGSDERTEHGSDYELCISIHAPTNTAPPIHFEPWYFYMKKSMATSGLFRHHFLAQKARGAYRPSVLVAFFSRSTASAAAFSASIADCISSNLLSASDAIYPKVT